MTANLPKTYGEAIASGYTVVDRRVQQIHYGNRAVYVSKKPVWKMRQSRLVLVSAQDSCSSGTMTEFPVVIP